MFDSHCHLDLIPVEERSAVLARGAKAGVQRMLVAGIEPAGWSKQRILQSDSVRCAYGVHPRWAHRVNITEAVSALESLCEIADGIGETGLDFAQSFREHENVQRALFGTHLALAQQNCLPLVLHVVRAHGAALELLSSAGALQGVVHSFSGSAEMVTQYVKLGLHISVSGSVCDPRSKKLRKAVEAIPDEALLVETDFPDQTPITRRPAPNEPAFLVDVIKEVAFLRGEEPETIAALTHKNASRLFPSTAQ